MKKCVISLLLLAGVSANGLYAAASPTDTVQVAIGRGVYPVAGIDFENGTVGSVIAKMQSRYGLPLSPQEQLYFMGKPVSRDAKLKAIGLTRFTGAGIVVGSKVER